MKPPFKSISLRDWFARVARRPLLFANFLAFSVAAIGMGFSLQNEWANQTKGFDQLVRFVSIGVSQNNRTLIESLLSGASMQFGSQATWICLDSDVLISDHGSDLSCTQPETVAILGYRTFFSAIPGFTGYSLHMKIPLVRNIGIFASMLGAILVLILGHLTGTRHTLRRLLTDLLQPLESGLVRTESLPISELENVRQAQIRALTDRVQSAVGTALIARDKQIAHDIRSPLAALGMLRQFADPLPEEMRDQMKTAIGRIREIANELARGIHDRIVEPIPSVVRLSDIISPVVSEKRLQYAGRTDIRILGPQAEYLNDTVVGDSVEFRRVVSNLIDNSVDSMGSGGTVKIDIASSPEAPGLRVSIQDQGRGIPSEILPRLGELGFTFKKPGGSGLGLHHAKTTLERFGGSLQIKSSLGVGTLIALEFMKYDTTRA